MPAKCWDGLKVDLTTDSKALDVLADIEQFEKQSWSKNNVAPLSTLTSLEVHSTLLAYKKMLDQKLSPAKLKESPVSPSAKHIAACERSKLSDLVLLGDLMKETAKPPDPSKLAWFKKNHDYLVGRFSKHEKVFGKNYPVPVKQLWADAEKQLAYHRGAMEAMVPVLRLP